MKKVIQHHGMIKKIAETQKKFRKMREQEMQQRIQSTRRLNPNRGDSNRTQVTSTVTSASSSNVLSSPAASSTLPAENVTESPIRQVIRALNTNSSTREVVTRRPITRNALRIHRQMNEDVIAYVSMDTSSSSDNDFDESDDGNEDEEEEGEGEEEEEDEIFSSGNNMEQQEQQV